MFLRVKVTCRDTTTVYYCYLIQKLYRNHSAKFNSVFKQFVYQSEILCKSFPRVESLKKIENIDTMVFILDFHLTPPFAKCKVVNREKSNGTYKSSRFFGKSNGVRVLQRAYSHFSCYNTPVYLHFAYISRYRI